MTATAFVFDSVVYINDPKNQTICIGDTAVMDCGYESSSGIVPQLNAVINGTALVANNSDFPPFIIVSNRNETTAFQVIIGPVEKQFAGIITFSCRLALIPSVDGITATLNVVGQYTYICIHAMYMYVYIQ